MRQFIISVGRPKFVLLLTILAILMAMGLTSLISILQNQPITQDEINRAIILPVIITPLIAWYLIGLFFELDDLEIKLNQMVLFDQLTGLMSRRAFFEGAEKALSYAERHQQPLSILALDLDHFKKINDKYGHQAGDMVLANLGELLQSIVRKSDLVGRLGGEEFAFILPKTQLEQAQQFAKKIQATIAKQQLDFKQNTISYSASIGMSEFKNGSNQSLDQLMYRADKALYQAKEHGRNRAFSFHAEKVVELVR